MDSPLLLREGSQPVPIIQSKSLSIMGTLGPDCCHCKKVSTSILKPRKGAVYQANAMFISCLPTTTYEVSFIILLQISGSGSSGRWSSLPQAHLHKRPNTYSLTCHIPKPVLCISQSEFPGKSMNMYLLKIYCTSRDMLNVIYIWVNIKHFPFSPGMNEWKRKNEKAGKVKPLCNEKSLSHPSGPHST